MSSALQQAAAAPLTALVAAANALIFLHMWNSRAGFAHVAISYRRVVLERQWYRVVSSAFCHLSALHLLMNMYGLWGFGALEAALGSAWYLETTCLLLLAGTACWLGGLHVLVARFGRTELADSSAVGYSGVLFGWMTLSMLRAPTTAIALPGGLALPVVVMPFVYLVLTKLVVPQSSFAGHLSGSESPARPPADARRRPPTPAGARRRPPTPADARRRPPTPTPTPTPQRRRTVAAPRAVVGQTPLSTRTSLASLPAHPAPPSSCAQLRPTRLAQLPPATWWAGPTSLASACVATGSGRRSCTSRASSC